jgi:predicted O-methyltransferase YrrM
MSIKEIVQAAIPSSIISKFTILKQARQLNAVHTIHCDAAPLRSINDVFLQQLFISKPIDSIWRETTKDVNVFNIPDGSGGVNPGDRRAIFYLVSQMKPSSVLEIGTHIGASTIHISSALYYEQIKKGITASLQSVDIIDVNSEITKPWLKYGSQFSPLQMINKLNHGSFVTFTADESLHFAANSDRKFDFIFLDGSHAASVVYQEIPIVLKILNPNGVILLHDYFPAVKDLWADGNVIPGPYLAIERLKKEGANLDILPLGKLPWSTKHGSNVTSLALLCKKI